MLRFTFPLAGLCLLTFFDRIAAAGNQSDFILAVNLQQNCIPLHDGIGVLALILATIGWFRRSRHRKSS
jgi:hypothetical protein